MDSLRSKRIFCLIYKLLVAFECVYHHVDLELNYFCKELILKLQVNDEIKNSLILDEIKMPKLNKEKFVDLKIEYGLIGSSIRTVYQTV